MDAGDTILISGREEGPVQQVLNDYVSRGSQLISPVSRVGSSWTAACTPPPTMPDDSAETLSLVGLQSKPQPNREVLSDGCRIEELGHKIIVYGPTEVAVKRRIDHLVRFGATIVVPPEESEGAWVAVCDTGGVANTGYRWTD
ncbi:MAG TPA: hypothetical protein VM183_04280 [Burkholderiales bacterium]|nr:hypothetical protein [Burkholderiales bacterium]